MIGRRKKIFLFLSIFFFLLVLDPAAYVQCTNIMPDQIMDILSVVKHENSLIKENKTKTLTARSILHQKWISAVSWQEYYIQTLVRSFPMWGIVIWGSRAIKKKDLGVFKVGDDPDSLTVSNLFDVRKVQFRQPHQASSPPPYHILRI